MDIPITPAAPPGSLVGARLEVEVAAQRTYRQLRAAPNQSFHFEWNGKDAYESERVDGHGQQNEATPPAPWYLVAMTRVLLLIEAFTVGLPFAAFKIVFGADLVHRGNVVGWILVGLGVVDSLLNTANLIALLIRGTRAVPVCLLHAAFGSSTRATEIALSSDVLLAFSLVAWRVGFASTALPSPSWQLMWNMAVVLNVLGAGTMRLARAVKT
jgi:hypothetical protein